MYYAKNKYNILSTSFVLGRCCGEGRTAPSELEHVEPVHAEPMHVEQMHVEPVHAEPVHAEPMHAEQMHVEQMPAEQMRRGELPHQGVLRLRGT
jgi:hypothetical protein